MQPKNILTKAAVIISLCAFCGSVFAAPTSKNLTKNEELYPQGWSVGEQVKFKRGTTVSLNEKGAVVTGALASDTYLRPQGWERVITLWCHHMRAASFLRIGFMVALSIIWQFRVMGIFVIKKARL